MIKRRRKSKFRCQRTLDMVIILFLGKIMHILVLMKTFINVDVKYIINYHCIDSVIKMQCKSHFILEEIRTLLCSIKRGMEYLIMACKFFHNYYFYLKTNTKHKQTNMMRCAGYTIDKPLV